MIELAGDKSVLVSEEDKSDAEDEGGTSDVDGTNDNGGGGAGEANSC